MGNTRAFWLTLWSRMYETGEWSDLTIRTATKSFKVHKSIVCPACPFFHAACTNGFKESQTGVIDLKESETVVDAMLRHIYELPIDWLRYAPHLLRYASTSIRAQVTTQHDSMMVTLSSVIHGLSEEVIDSCIEDTLELDFAADKV
jgi:hypothetical protein